MRKLLLLIAVAIVQPVAADSPVEQARQAIDRMIERRDAMTRYAVLLYGTHRGRPSIIAEIKDGARKFELRAFYQHGPNGFEHGAETVTISGEDTYKYRNAPIIEYYIPRPVARQLTTPQGAWCVGHPPFDSWLVPWNLNGHSGRQTIERHLARFKIVDAVQAADQLVVSLRESDGWGFDVTLDQAFGMMPVIVEQIGTRRDVTTISYKQLPAAGFLPATIHCEASRAVSDYRVHWLFGDEIPAACFDGPDHLRPLLDLFKIPHSRFDQTLDLWVPVDVFSPLDLPIPKEFTDLLESANL